MYIRSIALNLSLASLLTLQCRATQCNLKTSSVDMELILFVFILSERDNSNLNRMDRPDGEMGQVELLEQ